MREILFRGKQTDNGEWIEGSLVVAGDYCCILPADENSVHPTDYPYLDPETGTIDGHLISVDPSTVGQYTGLTANGKKIFEGDMIQDDDEDAPKLLYNVIFKDGSFLAHQIGGIFDEDIYLDNFISFGVFEGAVINNIHDNPELLEVEE